MTLELGIHPAWFARYQNQPFFLQKSAKLAIFGWSTLLPPGCFVIYIFFDFREYQLIQEKRIDDATSCPIILVVLFQRRLLLWQCHSLFFKLPHENLTVYIVMYVRIIGQRKGEQN